MRRKTKSVFIFVQYTAVDWVPWRKKGDIVNKIMLNDIMKLQPLLVML